MTCYASDLWGAFGFGFACAIFLSAAVVAAWAEIAWLRSGGRVE